MVDVPAGDWISVRQAAEMIRVPKRTVLNYIYSKVVTGIRVDGFWLVLRDDVVKLKKPANRPRRGRPRKET